MNGTTANSTLGLGSEFLLKKQKISKTALSFEGAVFDFTSGVRGLIY